MKKLLILLLAAIALAILGYFCIYKMHAAAIQNDITSKVNNALSGTGVSGVQAQVSGRDITLTGTVPYEADKEKIEKVAQVEGYNLIDNQIKVANAGLAKPEEQSVTEQSNEEQPASTQDEAKTAPQTEEASTPEPAEEAKEPEQAEEPKAENRLVPEEDAGKANPEETQVAAVATQEAETGEDGKEIVESEAKPEENQAESETDEQAEQEANAAQQEEVKESTEETQESSSEESAENKQEPEAKAEEESDKADDSQKSEDEANKAAEDAGAGSNEAQQAQQTEMAQQCQGELNQLLKTKVNFAKGSAIIKRSSYPLLDKVAEVATKCAQFKITVHGHTDSTGKDSLNKLVSQDRADSVVTYLVGKNIDAARLSAIGHGESKPIANNKTAKGRARNRRIELSVEVNK